ncbi:MAG: asparagine synthase C-terminal domain-containing protein [Parcubacteria group bacterium]|jgi:asparagine synthetase B (glutamine-hydrolysing)
MKVNDWKDVIALPVVGTRSKWGYGKLEEVLTEAILWCAVKCLRNNDGIICTTLSGGLDSSFCLAIMRELLGYHIPIHTFTTGGSEKTPDIQFARIVSQRFKTIHHELIPNQQEIKKAQEQLRFIWKDDPCSLGDVAVFLTYEHISQYGFVNVITHDGIDELLGGYWEHRRHEDGQKKTRAFQSLWKRLEKEHLIPLERKARHFSTLVILPYLQKNVVTYITKIPLESRTTFDESKIPLRTIAKKYLPEEIIKREKKGFCSALEEE